MLNNSGYFYTIISFAIIIGNIRKLCVQLMAKKNCKISISSYESCKYHGKKITQSIFSILYTKHSSPTPASNDTAPYTNKSKQHEQTTYTVKCTRNEDCSLTEICIDGGCHHPCDVHNPCAQNAVCVNTNHGTDCSCAEGYQGNGYVGCQPGKFDFFIHFICTWDLTRLSTNI